MCQMCKLVVIVQCLVRSGYRHCTTSVQTQSSLNLYQNLIQRKLIQHLRRNFRVTARKKPEYPLHLSTLPQFKSTGLSDQETFAKYDNVITEQYRAYLEQVTRKQSSSAVWKRQREGCITGAVAHDVVESKETELSTLLDKIMSPGQRPEHVKAVRYGIPNKAKVRELYSLALSQQHQSFSCRKSGFVTDKQDCYLGTSADSMVICDCCGRGVVEIKCSCKHQGGSIGSVVETDAKADMATHRASQPRVVKSLSVSPFMKVIIYVMNICHTVTYNSHTVIYGHCL